MKQSVLTKYMVALVVILTATSCKKESSSVEQMTENFKALVMGGKDIDPSQTWSTAQKTPVTISVNLQSGAKYTVYIYQAHPATSSDITYLGMAVLSSGESKTINVAQPADVSQLFAACFDAQNQVVCVPVVNGQATFSGTITTTTGTPTLTTGNNWSVPAQSMPDLSLYTSGSLIEASELDTDLPEDAEARLKISGAYTGFIPFLSTHTNMSVYVTSTWTLTYDQRINSGNVIVVGNGGKIIVPKGFNLTTTPLGEAATTGRIYVMPGGEISGEGTVEFSNETGGYNYNAGTIAPGVISVTDGIFYNAGIIGNSSNPATKLTGATIAAETPAQFVNLATAFFSEADASTLSILNGGTISVAGNLTLGQNARMDDGCSLSCNTLTLEGDGTQVLCMGNAAYLYCSGSLSVDNYGIWGPSGNHYTSNARLRVGGCTQVDATSGNAPSFLLDHVQLVVPTGASGLDLLSGWINGAQGDIERSRQTCFYQLEGSQNAPYENYMYYCFELPDGYSTKDFDYNDVILTVSAPYDYDDGTLTVYVDVIAIGTTNDTYIYYNGEQLGQEIHETMGVSTSTTVNTSSVTRPSRRLGMLTFQGTDVDPQHLSFSIKTTRNGSTQTYSQTDMGSDNAPLYLAVSGDEKGKWMWVKEGGNIGLAYRYFSTWASNQQSNANWYHSSNASSSQIVSW